MGCHKRFPYNVSTCYSSKRYKPRQKSIQYVQCLHKIELHRKMFNVCNKCIFTPELPLRIAPNRNPPKRTTPDTVAPNICRRSPLPAPSSVWPPPAPAKKTGSSTSDAASSSRWRKPHSWLKNVKQPRRGRCSSISGINVLQ